MVTEKLLNCYDYPSYFETVVMLLNLISNSRKHNKHLSETKSETLTCHKIKNIGSDTFSFDNFLYVIINSHQSKTAYITPILGFACSFQKHLHYFCDVLDVTQHKLKSVKIKARNPFNSKGNLFIR